MPSVPIRRRTPLTATDEADIARRKLIGLQSAPLSGTPRDIRDRLDRIKREKIRVAELQAKAKRSRW